MQDAAYYWNMFLQTGAPADYMRYRVAMTAAAQQPPAMCHPERSEGSAPNPVSS